MNPRTLSIVIAICIGVVSSTASAHYLWVTIDKNAGTHGTTNIYFEGGPGPGDGHYLDPFVECGKTWIRTVDAIKPVEIKTKDVMESEKRWLSAELPESAPRSIDSYGKWGVYRYGETDVLLHYYARHLDVESHDDLHELGRAEQMALDIVPHETSGVMELTVLWQGKPAANRTVSVRGPKGMKENLKTDEKGMAQFKIGEKGQYILKTNVEEKDNKGTFEGKDHDMVRHHATMILTLPLDG